MRRKKKNDPKEEGKKNEPKEEERKEEVKEEKKEEPKEEEKKEEPKEEVKSTTEEKTEAERSTQSDANSEVKSGGYTVIVESEGGLTLEIDSLSEQSASGMTIDESEIEHIV